MIVNRFRKSVTLAGLFCLSCCSGEVVQIRMPNQASNANGYYVCVPKGDASFDCKSDRAFHQYDRRLDVGKECAYGVADIHVETNGHGDVTRVQFSCAVGPVGGFPNDDAPAAPASSSAAPAPAPVAPAPSGNP